MLRLLLLNLKDVCTFRVFGYRRFLDRKKRKLQPGAVEVDGGAILNIFREHKVSLEMKKCSCC